MKRFKKLVLGVVAVVTCFGMTAMTACSGGSNGGDNTSIGSGEGDGSTSGGSGENGGSKELTNDEYVGNVVEATEKQQIVGFGATAEVTELTTSTIDSVAYKSESVSTGKATFNATTAEFDGILTVDAKATASGYASNAKAAYYAVFLRDGAMFMSGSTTTSQVPEFDSSVELSASEVSNSMMTTLNTIVALLSGDEAESGVDISTEVSAGLQLAITYNALSISGTTLTIDVAKIISGVYSDLNATIQSLDGTTSVSDILANANVKKILTALTSAVDTKEVYDMVVAELKTEEVSDEVIATIPVPTEGQSLYDYAVALVNDKTFCSAVLGEGAMIGDATVDDLLSGTGTDIATVKSMVSSYLSITDASDGGIVVTAGPTGSSVTVKIKKAEVSVTVGSDYSLKTIGINIDAGTSGASGTIGAAYDINADVVLTVYTSADMPTLTDISNCKVGSQTVTEYLASDRDSSHEYSKEAEDNGDDVYEDSTNVTYTTQIDY
jgi:hypothetical protein